ncbi:hypothetical protein LMG27198_46740 [Methylocystis echinoides]|uniref:Uncharacterized protein n=1 Tax=Methylocystis echinoides TaxID=29468 RepID=A0A9W6GYY2_9HYPH|nr:hypothetical protein LMG27198_46740 [Methylocystis echinoides]
MEAVAEAGSHPLNSPKDWWLGALGSGYRGTLAQLDAASLARVRNKNLASLAGQLANQPGGMPTDQLRKQVNRFVRLLPMRAFERRSRSSAGQSHSHGELCRGIKTLPPVVANARSQQDQTHSPYTSASKRRHAPPPGHP